MANEEQLSILKQGASVWNNWRAKNLGVTIDLSDVNLRGLNLSAFDFYGGTLIGAHLWRANFNGADLERADLSGANLVGANFQNANLSNVYLNGANLHEANLNETNLRAADLSLAFLTSANLWKANLNGAKLGDAILSRADLRESNLNEADLAGADFSSTTLNLCNFSQSQMSFTNFGRTDLSNTIGLEVAYHSGPSTLGIDTIAKSNGRIPDVFLRGCGLSDWEIEQVKLYNPDLNNEEVNEILYRIYDLRATQAIQISPLFISYGHNDNAFVDKLESQLNTRGIRFWRDTHNMKAGRIEKQINHAIRQNPTVLLVLSEHSLSSDWVEYEVRTARDLEKEMKRDVLCPVALDDSWKDSRWPKRIVEQIMEYNILDFSAWEDDSKFDVMFRRLIDGLELFYKG